MNTRIDEYDYHLPPELIARYPLARRQDSRLLVVDRGKGRWCHAQFQDLFSWLDEDDLLVANNTQVFPARLRGVKKSGGRVEVLLHHLPEAVDNGASPRKAKVRAFIRGHRLRVGQRLVFGPDLWADIISCDSQGSTLLFQSSSQSVHQAVNIYGEVPLPPYLRRPPEEVDWERYQTVFARCPGAIACPTAGLHFTEEILEELARRGTEVATITLHVGVGTFLPVRLADFTRHRLQPEYFELSGQTAARLNNAKDRGQRLVAVGTTTVRVLEYCASPQGFNASHGWCDLYIYPGYQFKTVDRLLTNFHLPRSTLLLLVSAFAGRELILAAYQAAIEQKYRFYSYGDAMLII